MQCFITELSFYSRYICATLCPLLYIFSSSELSRAVLQNSVSRDKKYQPNPNLINAKNNIMTKFDLSYQFFTSSRTSPHYSFGDFSQLFCNEQLFGSMSLSTCFRRQTNFFFFCSVASKLSSV